MIHGHYADAGHVGAQIAGLLGVPLIFTGHSLGREKRRRLIDNGMEPEAIEAQYNIKRRIDAEEMTLDNAGMVIASTHQEVETQYSVYDNYHTKRIVVIPPGVNLSRFQPPPRGVFEPPIRAEIAKFLRDPDKPMILAVARPDERKNLATLVDAYATHPQLREFANLVIFAGVRDDLKQMERGSRVVLNDLLLQFDRHDLYGSVAYPKHHDAADVPEIYRMAVSTRGVFVNPALTEPFGLTLLEAAASGLPVVATRDGGPKEIIGLCKNGLLVDPLNAQAMGEALRNALNNPLRWKRWSRNGIKGSRTHFCWDCHAAAYFAAITAKLEKWPRRRQQTCYRSRLLSVDRVIVTDIDNTLLGDAKGLKRFLARLNKTETVALGVATGRSLKSTLQILEENSVPLPDLLITGVGSEIHYGQKFLLKPGHEMIKDAGWQKHIDYRWKRDAIESLLKDVPGLAPQLRAEQHRYKLSYWVDSAIAPRMREIRSLLRQADIHATVLFSSGHLLDILPIRVNKGTALRYFSAKWGIPPDHILAAGDSGNDTDMLVGNTLAVVVGNHNQDLEKLRDLNSPRIYFATAGHAGGILEGAKHYRFFGDMQFPDEEDDMPTETTVLTDTTASTETTTSKEEVQP